jgi:hypothetical protein
MFDWLKSLSAYDNFRNCLNISERLFEEQYDLELALRFIVFRKYPQEHLRGIGELGTFLDDELMKIVENEYFDIDLERDAFQYTFDILKDTAGEESFKKYLPDQNRFAGSFLISAFELIALGIGYNYEHYKQNKRPTEIVETIKKSWTDERFTGAIGMGVRASSRIPVVIPLGREFFHI